MKIAVMLCVMVILLASCSQNTTNDIKIPHIILNGAIVSQVCKVDGDCMLINTELGFGCCYAGYCDGIDYSLEKWIAVRTGSFNSVHSNYCTQKCGPAPGCPTRLINGNFEAKCINNTCVKMSK